MPSAPAQLRIPGQQEWRHTRTLHHKLLAKTVPVNSRVQCCGQAGPCNRSPTKSTWLKRLLNAVAGSGRPEAKSYPKASERCKIYGRTPSPQTLIAFSSRRGVERSEPTHNIPSKVVVRSTHRHAARAAAARSPGGHPGPLYRPPPATRGDRATCLARLFSGSWSRMGLTRPPTVARLCLPGTMLRNDAKNIDTDGSAFSKPRAVDGVRLVLVGLECERGSRGPRPRWACRRNQ